MAEELYDHQTSTLMLKINDELICGICLDFFTHPVVLSCSHNFCRECLYSMAEANASLTGQRTCHCPLCYQSFNQNQLSHFPENRALESIIDLYKSCAPCDIFDKSWHSDLKPKIEMCKLHGKSLDKYCDSCSRVICIMCEKSDHSSQRAKHRVEPVLDAVCSYQTEIADSLTELKKKLMPLNERINYLENCLSAIEGKADRDKKQMDEKFSEMMRLLRSKQSNIISRMDDKVREQARPIQDDISKCNHVKHTVQDVVTKLSNFRRVTDTALLMQLMKSASKQLESLISLDINRCLRSQVQHSTSFLTFDLYTNNIIAAIEMLGLEANNGEGKMEKSLSSKTKDSSVQTSTEDDSTVSVNNVENSQSNNIEQQSELSPFKSKPPVVNGDTEGQRSPDGSLNSLDEQQSDLFRGDSVKVRDEIDGIRGEIAGIDYCRKKSPIMKPSTPQLDVNRNNSNGLDLSESVHDLDSGGAVPKVKSRQSFPTDLKSLSPSNSISPSKDIKVAKAKSAEKGKSSSKESSHSAALKTFVARRRTMSPSVSASSLDSMDKSGQEDKLSLRSFTARKNASSPALKSLDSGFTSTNGDLTSSSVEQTAKTSSVDVKVSSSPLTLDAATTKDAGVSKSPIETKKTEGVKVLSAAKSFTAEPISFNLDLALEIDDTSNKRITNV